MQVHRKQAQKDGAIVTRILWRALLWNVDMALVELPFASVRWRAITARLAVLVLNVLKENVKDAVVPAVDPIVQIVGAHRIVQSNRFQFHFNDSQNPMTRNKNRNETFVELKEVPS